jgi:hypothetical protein
LLFVRSQFIEDSLWWPGTDHAVRLNSLFGHMRMSILTDSPGSFRPFKYLHEWAGAHASHHNNPLGFYFARSPGGVVFDAPSWPFWLFGGVMTAAPWVSYLPWSNRFSLRTLLITSTLVAVVLGLIAWAAY